MLVTVIKVGDGWNTRDFEIFETTPDVFLRIKQWVKDKISKERDADLSYIRRSIHSASHPAAISMLETRLTEKDQEYNMVLQRLESHAFHNGSAFAFHHTNAIYMIEQKHLFKECKNNAV